MAVNQLDVGQRSEAPPDSWRILVVDDESNMTELLTTMLSGQGYEIRKANSGRDALAICDAIQKSDASGRFEKVKHF